MALLPFTEEQKRRIKEEEEYRAQIREDLNSSSKQKPKKRGIGCLTAIIIFVVIGAIGSAFSSSNSSTNISERVEDKDLNGNVSFNEGVFVVVNNEDRDWKSCYFKLNGKYNYPSRTSDWEINRIDGIVAGDTVTIGSAAFTLNSGERFNPFSMKAQELTISCKNGFGSWTW